MPTDGLLFPPPLRTGDTVAVISPSWPSAVKNPGVFHGRLKVLERAGYRVHLMPNARLDGDWVCGTPQQRAADLHEAFADPDVHAVACDSQGFHHAQLLPLLDFELIAANPKVLTGIQGVTSLHHAIHARTGLVTCYGSVGQLHWRTLGRVLRRRRLGGRPTVVRTIDHFHAVFGQPEAAGPIPRTRDRNPANRRHVLREGRASGPLLVTHPYYACSLLGTPWQPDYAGRVLVLVLAGNHSPADLDSSLTHLRLAGSLDELSALVVCRPYAPTPIGLELLDDVVAKHTADYGYPVVTRVEGVYTDPAVIYPIGVRATIDVDELTLDEPAVAEPPGSS